MHNPSKCNFQMTPLAIKLINTSHLSSTQALAYNDLRDTFTTPKNIQNLSIGPTATSLPNVRYIISTQTVLGYAMLHPQGKVCHPFHCKQFPFAIVLILLRAPVIMDKHRFFLFPPFRGRHYIQSTFIHEAGAVESSSQSQTNSGDHGRHIS